MIHSDILLFINLCIYDRRRDRNSMKLTVSVCMEASPSVGFVTPFNHKAYRVSSKTSFKSSRHRLWSSRNAQSVSGFIFWPNYPSHIYSCTYLGFYFSILFMRIFKRRKPDWILGGIIRYNYLAISILKWMYQIYRMATIVNINWIESNLIIHTILDLILILGYY